MSWRDPFKVLKAVNKVDYLIDVKGKPKLYHVNLLKKYFRSDQTLLNVADEHKVSFVSEQYNSEYVNVCVVDTDDLEESSDIITVSSDTDHGDGLDVCKNLCEKQKAE